MSIFSPFDHNDAAYQEPIAISSPVLAAQYFLEEPHSNATNATIIVAIGGETPTSAPALMRERDVEALSCLFDIDDIDEIEADIKHHLFLLLPPPLFLDDPFDFLQEYL